jgi:hypothetical protein
LKLFCLDKPHSICYIIVVISDFTAHLESPLSIRIIVAITPKPYRKNPTQGGLMKSAMKFFLVAMLLSIPFLSAAALDGTFEGAVSSTETEADKPEILVRQTDDVFVLNPIESVSTGSSVWRDNRHRAYFNFSTIANGFLLFDVSAIPDDATITSMTLTCYLENAYGSPMSNPQVDVYYSEDDGWTRSSVSATSLSLDVLLQDNVLFTSYIYSYDFVLDVGAHDWTQDLIDNEICIGFKNDRDYYSYVYFFGAYGSPTGPPPELTIETGTGGPYDLFVDLTYVSGSPVSPGGGNIYFEVFVENQDSNPADFDGWLAVEYAGGPPTTVASRIFTNFLPGWTINRPDMFYPVPGAWAAGNYEMYGRVGDEPGDVWAEDGFPFVKSGVSDGSAFVPWAVDGAPNPFDEITKPEEAVLPSQTVLHGAYPNPFNPATVIRYQLPAVSFVNLAVYDLSGRKVTELVNGWRDAGSHEAAFDASDRSSGIYIYRLTADDYYATGKMLLIK